MLHYTYIRYGEGAQAPTGRFVGVKRRPPATRSLARSVPEQAAALRPGLTRCPWQQHRQRSPQALSSGPRVFHSPVLTPQQPRSLVDLFHLPDDLFFEDGQDGVILPHLLEDYTTVELITHFLKVIPEKPETWGQRRKKGR